MIVSKFDLQKSELEMLETICSKWSFWGFSETVKFLKQDHYHLFYQTTDNEEVCGLIFFSLVEGVADLLYIYVLDKFRNKSVARNLFDAMVKLLECNNIKSLMLEVRLTNIKAIKLYNSVGMTKIHTRKKYYSDGEDACIYQMDIRKKAKR